MLIEDKCFGHCSECNYDFNSELINEYHVLYCPKCGKGLYDSPKIISYVLEWKYADGEGFIHITDMVCETEYEAYEKTDKLLDKENAISVKRIPVVECCGEEIYCSSFTNTCPRCGNDFNMNGSLLAPRSQWDEY